MIMVGQLFPGRPYFLLRIPFSSKANPFMFKLLSLTFLCRSCNMWVSKCDPRHHIAWTYWITYCSFGRIELDQPANCQKKFWDSVWIKFYNLFTLVFILIPLLYYWPFIFCSPQIYFMLHWGPSRDSCPSHIWKNIYECKSFELFSILLKLVVFQVWTPYNAGACYTLKCHVQGAVGQRLWS